MPLPVFLGKVVDEIDKSIEGAGALINRETGEIVSGDLELMDDVHGLPSWAKKIGSKIRAAASSEDWLLLPGEFRCETETMIERFCKEYCVGAIRREMLTHLRSGMSVGELKFKLTGHELYDSWEEFRRERITELAAAWLTEKGITFRK